MRFDLFNQFNQLGMRDRLPVHLDAFDVILQMRRGIQPGLIPGCGQCRSHQRGGGTFALRPGHVEDRVLLLRVAKQSHQCPHPLQVEISLGEFGGFFQAIIYERIQVIESLVVGGFGVHW